MPFKVKTRDEAFRDGNDKYYTGKPCKNGHTSLRYVRNGACIDCSSTYNSRFRNKMAQPQGLKKTISYTIQLYNAEDIQAVDAYVRALNFERELNWLAMNHTAD